MSAMEIILLIIGTLVFVVSFFVPETEKQKNKIEGVDEKAIAKVVDGKVDDAKERIDGIVDEAVQYALEKTERSLERVSNEKIMAVSEFSDTVIKEIDKNHQEVVFLYDMLNNKSVDLKNTVREAEQVKKDTKEMAIESINAIENAFSEMSSEDDTSDIIPDLYEPSEVTQADDSADIFDLQSDISEALATTSNPETISEPLISNDDELANLGDAIVKATEDTIEATTEVVAQAEEDVEQSAMVAFGFGKDEIEEPAVAKAETKPKTERKTRARRTTSKRAAAKNLQNMDITFDAMGDSGKNKNEKILELHRQGKSNVEVARELGLGMGEVKLVIDLFEN